MAKRPEPQIKEPLTDDEFGKLDDLLLSDDLSEECMLAETLEGFLTAIAIGPVTVTPEQWLPRVFGGDPEDPMPGSRYWMRSPVSCGFSNYSPHRKVGQNRMRRRTRRRCMRSGPARLNRRSMPYMLIGYLIEKALENPDFAPFQEICRKVYGGTQCALPLWERKEVQTLLWFRTHIALIPLQQMHDEKSR